MFNNKKNLSILAFFLLVLFLFIFQYFSSQKQEDAIMTEDEVITNTSEVSQKSMDEAITETFPVEKAQGSFDVVRIDNDGVSVLAGKSPPNQIIKIYKDDFLIAEGLSDSQGNWVITLDDNIPNEVLNLKISTTNPGDQIEVFSDQIVTIMPSKIVDNAENLLSDENIVLLTQDDKASQILSIDPSFLQDET
ncbi:MAG: hypothetical protein VXU43_04985, partial [Pseudomonadota bacterium]|nr:hypothetical protein [Pseudomonadota bacterium]